MQTTIHRPRGFRLYRSPAAAQRLAPGAGREDRIFRPAIPVLISAEDLGPGGSRDWGNSVLSEADFFTSLQDERS